MQDKKLTVQDIRTKINEHIDDYVIEHEDDINEYSDPDREDFYENPLLDSFEKFCEKQLIPEITDLMIKNGYSKKEIDYELRTAIGDFYYQGMCRTDHPRIIKKRKALLAEK